MKPKHPSDPRRAAARAASLSRRHFLRGLGASIALPALASLRPFTALAAEPEAAARLAATATGAPLRTVFVFFPNGAIPAGWWPGRPGPDFEFSDTLRALAPFRQHLQVVGGLDHASANPGPDGPGDHARATGVFLTGVRLNKSDTDIRAGISIDQVIARHTGHLTRFPSLELTCDNVRPTSSCDFNYSCAYQYNLSWTSPTTPAAPAANPRLVFERLFGAGAPGERAANLRRHQREQRSVLDFVLDDARRLRDRLATEDRDKLEQYLTGVRSIETRIQSAERLGPPLDPAVATPAGIPADHAEYVRLMYDLLVLAFQTDSTRVATLCLAHDGDNRAFPEIGIHQAHHSLSHHVNVPERIRQVMEIDRWYVKQFAYFLQRLQEARDSDGQSLLHNSMIVYGGGTADANLHTHSNLPILLSGNGGGALTTGRYLQNVSDPLSNLFLSLADCMGVTGLDRFGDSTGRLRV